MENYISLTSLYNALAAFDGERSKALEISLSGTQQIVDGNDASYFELEDAEAEGGASTASKRRYSFANLNAVNFDPDSIDVAYLEEVSIQHSRV